MPGEQRGVARRTDSASEPVQKRPLHLALYAFFPPAGWVIGNEVREQPCDRRRISVHFRTRLIDRALVHWVCDARLGRRNRMDFLETTLISTTCPAVASLRFSLFCAGPNRPKRPPRIIYEPGALRQFA
jgi:hypothetical protein